MSDDLSPDQFPAFDDGRLDELLSAELDGELDAAAADLGLDVATARARMSATPNADERRRALAAARDRLAEPVEIEELLAARLRTKAVRAAVSEQSERDDDRRRGRRRLFVAVAGVAAAIIAVAAIAATARSHHAGSESASSKSVAAAPAAPPSTRPTPRTGSGAIALGSFDSARNLGQAAVDQALLVKGGSWGAATNNKVNTSTPPLAADAPAAPAHEPTTTAGGFDSASAPLASSQTTVPGQAQSVFGAAASAPNSKQALITTCPTPPQVAGGDTLVLRATATLAGKPVVVLVFVGASEHVVVVEDTHCALVNLQTFG